MKYMLKRTFPPFEMVDGPLAGRQYDYGREYEASEIPEQYRDRFEEVKQRKAETRQTDGGQSSKPKGSKNIKTEDAAPGAVVESIGKEG